MFFKRRLINTEVYFRVRCISFVFNLLKISEKYDMISIYLSARRNNMPQQKTGKKIIVVNRKVRHDYFVEDTYEAGIALYGTEVKSIRLGQVNLKDSYCKVIDGELFAIGVHVSPYEKGNIFNRDSMRDKNCLCIRRKS